jgi:hypothetical protein
MVGELGHCKALCLHRATPTQKKQDRECRYKVTLSHFRVTIFAMEIKQYFTFALVIDLQDTVNN